MYIGRTSAYYDCDDDYIFTPDLWDIEDDAEKLAGDISELTEEGEELCYRYFHDLSCGYDLCNGRAKGLAAEYSREEFFAYVTDEKNGYIKRKSKTMTKLAKKDLQLVGSAGNMDVLKSLIKSKLYWSEVNTAESSMYESRLGKVYEVGNRNGVVSDMVIIEGARCSLYRIK